MFRAGEKVKFYDLLHKRSEGIILGFNKDADEYILKVGNTREHIPAHFIDGASDCHTIQYLAKLAERFGNRPIN